MLIVAASGVLWRQWSDATIPWSAFSDAEVLSTGRHRDLRLRLREPLQFPPKRRRGFQGEPALLIRANGLEGNIDQIIDAVVQILIQPCDELDQPIGTSQVVFTGRVDNKIFDDQVSGQVVRSTMTLEVVNRFTLRRVKSDRVLSDADQRARSAAVNPGENPDRFCERVPLLEDKTRTWPRWK